jgi:acyl carrier protein
MRGWQMTVAATREALGLTGEYAAPETQLERALAQLWSERLRIHPIGVRDDFFELGGDSLLAADLALAVDRAFGVEVPAAVLFTSPTIAELARALERARDEPE